VKVNTKAAFLPEPIFALKWDGKPVIGVANGLGLQFFSADGKLKSELKTPLAAAKRLPSDGADDELILRTAGDDPKLISLRRKA